MNVLLLSRVFAATQDILGNDLPKPVQWLLAIGVGGIVVELIRGAFQRKKIGADYADVISNSAVRLLKPLEERIRELEEQVEEARAQVREARTELTLAYTEIHELRQRLHDDIVRNDEDRQVRGEERDIRTEERDIRSEERDIRRISRREPGSEQ